MISTYNVDERLMTGIRSVILDNFNTVVSEHNAEYDDGIMMSNINENNLYSGYVTVEQLLESAFRFPAIAYYIQDGRPEEKNNSISLVYTFVRFAIFTDELNGDTMMKRYLVALRQIINEQYTDIDACVFKVANERWQYFVPMRYKSNDLNIAELEVQIVTEVRK